MKVRGDTMSFPKTYTFKAIFIAEACDALSLHLLIG